MFLDQSNKQILPPTESIQCVVDNFNTYFVEKVDKIRQQFPNNSPVVDTYKDFFGQIFSEFEPTRVEEIKEILDDTAFKTSSNDPLPSSLLKDNLDEILPHFCELVNLSLSTGNIEGAKLAHIIPVIKGESLDDSNLKNYRPISNISFVGKLIERVVLKQLNKHLDSYNLDIPFQSAYKKCHSTETLLVRIVNDLLIATDENKATIVMLLDLSAAFDTIDHDKLLNILKYEIGIRGKALQWFESFVHGRCQKIRIGNVESAEIIIKFGVPQGSVLGPVLFNL